MATDQAVMLNTLMGAMLAFMLVIHSLPTIRIDLPALSWQTVSMADACFESDFNGCMLGP
jgi:hypothetical protein